MKISNYLDTKRLKYEELKENFFLLRSFRKDMTHADPKVCFNCGNELNSYMEKSEPWTSVQHCVACNSLNLVIWTDRMGGVYEDTVEVYKEKL